MKAKSLRAVTMVYTDVKVRLKDNGIGEKRSINEQKRLHLNGNSLMNLLREGREGNYRKQRKP